MLLRNPNDVCKDLQESGWYKNKYYKSNDNSVLGYQGISTKFSNKHHNFSRLAPKGKLFLRWNKLNPLAKSKWYWDEVNTRLIKDLKKINKKNYTIVRIEDLKFEKYVEICNWLKIKPILSKIQFKFLRNIQQIKNIKIKDRDKKILGSYKSKFEKKFYPENFR